VSGFVVSFQVIAMPDSLELIHALEIVIVLIVLTGIVSVTVLGMYRLRYLAGHSLLFMVLGAFQYMQYVLASLMVVRIWGDFGVSPGSAILFPANLFVILLLYVKKDAIELKRVCLMIGILNAWILIFSTVLHCLSPEVVLPQLGNSPPQYLPSVLSSLLWENTSFILAGTLLLLLDIAIMLRLFDWMAKLLGNKHLFGRLFVPLFAGLMVDAIGYTIYLCISTHRFELALFVSQVLSKAIACLIYTFVLWSYVRIYENQSYLNEADGDLAGEFLRFIFQSHRYNALRDRLVKDPQIHFLYNRAFLVDELGRARAISVKTGKPFGLMLIKIPEFDYVHDESTQAILSTLLEFEQEHPATMLFRLESDTVAILLLGPPDEYLAMELESMIAARLGELELGRVRLYYHLWAPGRPQGSEFGFYRLKELFRWSAFQPIMRTPTTAARNLWASIRVALFGFFMAPRQILAYTAHQAQLQWTSGTGELLLLTGEEFDTSLPSNMTVMDDNAGERPSDENRKKLVLHEAARLAFAKRFDSLIGNSETEGKWIAFLGENQLGLPQGSRAAMYKECVRLGCEPGSFLIFEIEPSAVQKRAIAL
jgi:hypothetical protein